MSRLRIADPCLGIIAAAVIIVNFFTLLRHTHFTALSDELPTITAVTATPSHRVLLPFSRDTQESLHTTSLRHISRPSDSKHIEPIDRTTASHSGYPPAHLRSILSPSFFAPQRRVPLNRGRTSGLCIAVTSSPRVQPDSLEATWKHVRRLLLALDGKRARDRVIEKAMWAIVYSSGCEAKGEGEPLRGNEAEVRGKKYQGTDESKRQQGSLTQGTGANSSDEQLRQDLIRQLKGAVTGTGNDSIASLVDVLLQQRATSALGLVREHTQVIERTAGEIGIETHVLTAHPEGCALLQDAEKLLRWVPPAYLEDGWRRWLWRTKLALDFIHVTYQCLATRPRHMLLLQDDAFPADLWDVGIEKFMVKDLRGRPPWTLLSFYYPQSFNDWDPYHHAERYLVPCCAQALHVARQ